MANEWWATAGAAAAAATTAESATTESVFFIARVPVFLVRGGGSAAPGLGRDGRVLEPGLARQHEVGAAVVLARDVVVLGAGPVARACVGVVDLGEVLGRMPRLGEGHRVIHGQLHLDLVADP